MMNKNDMPATKCVGHKLNNDSIFRIVLLVCAVGIGALVYFGAAEGDVVRVTVDGNEFATYRLDEDISVDIITGDGGEHIIRLVIKDGRARIEAADCPDGICVSHKPISRENESIICLPNRVVVTVYSTKDDNAPDVVS